MNTKTIFAFFSTFFAVALAALLLIGCAKSFKNDITLLFVTSNEISTSKNTSGENQSTGTNVPTKSTTSRDVFESTPITSLTSFPTTDIRPDTSDKGGVSDQKSKSTTSREPVTSLSTSSLPDTSEPITTESKVSDIPSTSEISTDIRTGYSTDLPITTDTPVTSQFESTSASYAITSVGSIPHTEW